jgi:SAM-dependent methyltransferase
MRFAFSARDGFLGVVPGEFRYSLCRSCGLFGQVPRPDRKALMGYYPKRGYYSFHPDRKGALSRIFWKFYNALSLGKDRAPLVRGGNLLDVGCGDGEYLSKISGKMNGYGVEPMGVPDKSKPHIRTCYLEEAKFPRGFFDVVLMSHSLEHMNDPVESLIEVRRIIKTGGKLVISLPTTSSFGFAVFKGKWFHTDAPRHIFIYNERNLSRLLEGLGFSIREIHKEGSPIGLVGSIYYALAGKSANLKKYSKVLSLISLLFFPASWIANIFGAGDTLTLIAERKSS